MNAEGGCAVCEEMRDDADWQWNVSSWSKQDSPATAVAHALLAEQGDVAMLDVAFGWLSYGQRHDVQAQARYHACRAHGDDHLYLAVVGACGRRRSDVDEAMTHLEWQLYSDPLSVVAAVQAWRGTGASAARARVGAMYHLMRGQWHNASACQLYRACFAEDAVGFFARCSDLADEYPTRATRHPYLMGDKPSPFSIRDEVPGIDETDGR